jgi:nucleotide-binding universal stress UspA family protein
MTTSTPLAPTDVREEAGNGPGDPPAREVLVGVDGSEVGLAAVRWAAQEAARRNAPLRILHAASYIGRRGTTAAPSPELHRARRITAQAYTLALHTAPGVKTFTEIVPGDATASLLHAAAGGQLVVLGSSATGAPDEMVLATVAMRVAARSPHPVVVVPRRRHGEPTGRPAVAILGVGDRADDEAVAVFAATSAERFGVPLSVLQTRPAGRKASTSWVDDPAEWEARYPGLEVRRRDLPAARAEQVLGETCPSPLLVISAGHGDLLHRFLDGPHRWLLRHSTSPMALVPRVRRPEQEPREEAVASG